jgi:hypothetical protein
VTTNTPSSIRIEIADVLDAWAAEAGWSDQLWQRFDALIKSVEVDGLLSHADEELNHYGGEFNSYNLLGVASNRTNLKWRNTKKSFAALLKLCVRGQAGKSTRDRMAFLKAPK